jgi:apolipoprotein D and lipocalin family protein
VIYLTKEEHNTLEVVPHVELEKYLGKWYEIARLPFRFEDGCTDITATYSLSKDGNVSVLNECLKDGKLKQAKGKAKVVDKKTGAKLKVTFFWPFSADYWIINLGENYDYAVVGSPSRKYLWILSRTPQMDDKLFSQLVESVKSKGFNVENLIKTSHKR